MRFTLVILYFAAIHYILRPLPPADIDIAAPAPPPGPETGRYGAPPSPNPQRTEAWQVPTRAAPEPAPEAPVAETPDGSTSDAAANASSGTVADAEEQAGEQRTSTRAPEIELDMRDANLERRIQTELVRLACLVGQPEKRWGSKSRAALKRFAQRAKAKDETLDAALLRLLRRYPADYCKLCKPGQDACKLDAQGGAPKKSDLVPEMIPDGAPTALPSYLPPWLNAEKVAKLEENAEVRTDAASAPGAPKPKKKVQRRRPTRNAASTARRAVTAAPIRRVRSWPLMAGWPSGR
jgi:hypothetical protein